MDVIRWNGPQPAVHSDVDRVEITKLLIAANDELRELRADFHKKCEAGEADSGTKMPPHPLYRPAAVSQNIAVSPDGYYTKKQQMELQYRADLMPLLPLCERLRRGVSVNHTLADITAIASRVYDASLRIPREIEAPRNEGEPAVIYPVQAELVRDITITNSEKTMFLTQRIMSPRYVVDLEELTPSALARMMVAGEDMATEFDHQIRQLARRFREAEHTNVIDKPRLFIEYTPMVFYARIDGFLFECFGAVNYAGVGCAEAEIESYRIRRVNFS